MNTETVTPPSANQPSSAVAEMMPLMVEAAEAARLCGISRATWYAMRKSGKVPKPVRLGGRVQWRVDELHEWVRVGCPPLARWENMKKGRWS